MIRSLESDDIRTGLAMMARRFDTGSPWLISNNPRAPYWERSESICGYIGNRHYRLSDMVRASTAAPGFFQAADSTEIVEGGEMGLFIDGGLSPYNNPIIGITDAVPGEQIRIAMEDGSREPAI